MGDKKNNVLSNLVAKTDRVGSVIKHPLIERICELIESGYSNEDIIKDLSFIRMSNDIVEDIRNGKAFPTVSRKYRFTK